MRALITGAGGFAGQYLAAHLLEMGDEVYGIARRAVAWHVPGVDRHPGFHLATGDVSDTAWTQEAVERIQPDQVYLLAAKSSVPASFAAPLVTLQENAAVVVSVLEAIKALAPRARALVVSSSEVYGPAPTAEPMAEHTELRPQNPYAVSKVAQDLLGYQYFRAHNLSIVRVRPFNHTGPGQSSEFVASAFASQVAAIERGWQPPVIKVGNLSAQRDFTDVRDMVRAYRLAASAGEAGAVYNVGRGESTPVQSLLDYLCEQSRVPIEVQVDAAKFRPVDAPIQVCDASALRQHTGWRATIPLTRTLDDLLEHWRGQDASFAR